MSREKGFSMGGGDITRSASVNSEGDEQINAVLPKEQAGYFQDMEAKHFDPEKGVGSLFTEAKNVEELLKKALEQRGNLDGDDRGKFIAMGVKPEALMDFCRYLKVETPGEVGIANVKDLDPHTKVKVIRTKQGAPCSLVVEGTELPVTDFGTIIIGPNEKDEKAKPEDPEPSTKEMIWTVHPGLPVRPATEDIWPEGSEITVQEVIDKLGNDIFLNVKKTELASVDYDEYKSQRDEMEKHMSAKEGGMVTKEFNLTLNSGEEIQTNYIDEIVTRGPGIMITTTAVEGVRSRYTPPAKSREAVQGYQMFAGAGRDAGGMLILTKDRNIVKSMHEKLARKYEELGYTRAIDWLMNKSEYANMESPDHPGQRLIQWLG